ncbi:MAG: hypothetical protein B7Z70_11465 [Acidithiobacillus ferrivorans]|uniref:Uncharacterized protein n=1 Tax=Acidithiobacillus ferrivorans TaxID=160808 RepID=A0A257SRF4_9PROT|nr:MAG: hypothetical protein B7Z70_11465 [Acidithiobacillus ferrivorans]
MTGPASGSAGGNYGEGYAIELLYAAAAEVQIPFAIPKPSPYTGGIRLYKGGSGTKGMVNEAVIIDL